MSELFEKYFEAKPGNSIVCVCCESKSPTFETFQSEAPKFKSRNVEVDIISIDLKEEDFSALEFVESSVNTFIGMCFPPEQSFGFMQKILNSLKPNGSLQLFFDKPSIQQQDLAKLQGHLLLGGFMNISISNTPLPEQPYHMSATKPEWASGEKAAIAINGSAAPIPTIPAPTGVAPPAATWNISADDLEEEDLVDEDALLGETPLPVSAPLGCGPNTAGGGVKKKRACKNCSCGLKEMEEAEEAGGPPVKIDPLEKSSACGNCSKGDAFRCATCPFLGKPAFKPGEEALILALDDTNEKL
mmetsp:Transcript_32775/g.42074  ORF Transcript_32775/g.42074 Transcript_32775/m.42074 type:complete len:301 (+) Transcript_32775:61-963(+)